jgi:hypothetical protein
VIPGLLLAVGCALAGSVAVLLNSAALIIVTSRLEPLHLRKGSSSARPRAGCSAFLTSR